METKNSRIIKASPEKIYQAITDPKAMEIWQVPGEMTGKVHNFELKEGSGYTMSLYYPENEKTMKGKTGESEDRFTATFVELTPPTKIIEAINF